MPGTIGNVRTTGKAAGDGQPVLVIDCGVSLRDEYVALGQRTLVERSDIGDGAGVGLLQVNGAEHSILTANAWQLSETSIPVVVDGAKPSCLLPFLEVLICSRVRPIRARGWTLRFAWYRKRSPNSSSSSYDQNHK